jgi:PBP superfamily domain
MTFSLTSARVTEANPSPASSSVKPKCQVRKNWTRRRHRRSTTPADPGPDNPALRREIANWKDVGGNDEPVRLVDRYSDSGTRRTFEEQVLGGSREPGDNSDDFLEPASGAAPGVVRCARASTNEVLDAVARTRAPSATASSGPPQAATTCWPFESTVSRPPSRVPSTRHDPFWTTEYAYTYGEPRADSVTASFLRYLTNQVGNDIARSYGHRPCDELENSALCRPLAHFPEVDHYLACRSGMRTHRDRRDPADR